MDTIMQWYVWMLKNHQGMVDYAGSSKTFFYFFIVEWTMNGVPRDENRV